MSDEMERAEKRLILAALAPITLADAVAICGLPADTVLVDQDERRIVMTAMAVARFEYADALLSQAGL